MSLTEFKLPPDFHADPYKSYAELLRSGRAIVRVGEPYNACWVLSAPLVREVCARKTEFLKPGKDRTTKGGPLLATTHLKDGLFFMDPERHTQVRALLEPVFTKAIADAPAAAVAAAGALVKQGLDAGRIDAVNELARPLATQVFMQIMGIPAPPERYDARLVDDLIRTALDLRDPALPVPQRMPGANAALAVRTYLHARRKELAADCDAPGSILAQMGPLVACQASAVKMDSDEAMNTAAHFALGGYLSTEFLIGSGILNLLRTPGQFKRLRDAPGLLDAKLDAAVNEMLRFDAPFQMAERWVGADTDLGGETIPKGSLVVVVYGSANRDPQAFETVAGFGDPGSFDIERPAAANFGFGDGIHYCIGAPLARIVAAAAVRELVTRCPQARIVEQGPWSRDPYFRRLTKLVLNLH